MKSFSKSIPLNLTNISIKIKVACSSVELGYDFVLVSKQVINSQAKVIIFAESNVIRCCPERKREYVVHMKKIRMFIKMSGVPRC